MTTNIKMSQVWNDYLKVGDTISPNEFKSLCKQMGVLPSHLAKSNIKSFFLYRLIASQATETSLPSGLLAYEKRGNVVQRDVSNRKPRVTSMTPSTPAPATTQSPDLDDLTIGRSIIRVIQKLATKVKEQSVEIGQLVEEKAQLERQCRELKERLCQLNNQKAGSTISLHRLQELVNGGGK